MCKSFRTNATCSPPETLFHILLDGVITDDVVAKHLSFYAFLTTLASSVWGHHPSTLTSAAVWVLGKVNWCFALAASALRSSGFLLWRTYDCHHPEQAHLEVPHPHLPVQGTTVRSAWRTISSDACPSCISLLRKLCMSHPRLGRDLRLEFNHVVIRTD